MTKIFEPRMGKRMATKSTCEICRESFVSVIAFLMSIHLIYILDIQRYAAKDKPDQEIVILSQILAADINVTYQQYVPNIVTHANNAPIRNLQHLVEVCSTTHTSIPMGND